MCDHESIMVKMQSWNFLIRLGYLVACQYLLRVQVGGLMFGGLPCSMHVWMSRGTSKKSRSNPRGVLKNGGYAAECVRLANLIAARYALLALICLARAVYWITEQPASSVAHHLPYIKFALYPARLMTGFAGAIFQRLCFDSIG